jgi:hypothetical protein
LKQRSVKINWKIPHESYLHFNEYFGVAWLTTADAVMINNLHNVHSLNEQYVKYARPNVKGFIRATKVTINYTTVTLVQIHS